MGWPLPVDEFFPDRKKLLLSKGDREMTLPELGDKIAELRGKHKPIWAPHLDTGDHVIVVNAALLDVSARKAVEKQYYRHSGYPGGLRATSYTELLEKHPTRAVEKAVRGMLPKNSLAKQKLRGKLKVYGGAEHPHAAQQPKPYTLGPAKVTA